MVATPAAQATFGSVDVPALYAAHWQPMVRLAVLLVGDLPSAEDAVQEAFIALYRHQTSLREPGAALAYVRTAVVNRCRSDLRHRMVARSRQASLVTDEEGPQRAAFDAVGVDTEMLAALRQLPQRMQEVLVLRYWSDLSEAEIAHTLGISAGAVKSTASRGIAKLRDLLGGAR